MMFLLSGCESLTAALSGEPPPPPPITYTVKRGDTLWAIAKQHDVTIDQIKGANGLTSDTIEIGQVLEIPTTDAPAVADAKPRAPRAGRPRTSPSGRRDANPGRGGGGSGAPTAGLRLPAEKPCREGPSLEDLGDDDVEMVGSEGLTYAQVKAAMDVYLGRLSRCVPPGEDWPVGRAMLDITVACSGRLTSVRVESSEGLSNEVLNCTQHLLRYTAFPAHDMPDGYTFSYPLTFSQ